MTEKLFVIISEYIIGAIVIMAIVTILLASWYDFRLALAKRQLQRTSTRLNKSRQSLITVIVYISTSSPSSISRCLDSVLRSHYINYQVVVANHTSGSSVRRTVKDYQKSHPKTPITLYTAQAASSRDQVIQRAVKKVPASDYIMTIDNFAEISRDSLRRVMAQFIHTPDLRQLGLRQASDDELSMQSLVPQFALLIKNSIYKALATIRLLPSISSSVSIAKHVPSTNQRYYVSDITYYKDNVLTQSKPQITHVLLKLFACTAAISLISYWMWTAATLKSNLLLTLSWIVLSISLLAVIWSDSLVKISRKIELTVTVPFMYFFLYTHALIGLFKSTWHLICRYPYQKQISAFKAELYSTKY